MDKVKSIKILRNCIKKIRNASDAEKEEMIRVYEKYDKSDYEETDISNLKEGKSMIELRGKYNNAIVYTDNIEQEAISQIITLLNQPFAEQNQIRFMPDVHAGKGCTIGFTMKMDKIVCPNLVGVDIGCGVLVAKLGNIDIDFEKLDKVIRERVPFGFNVHDHQKLFHLEDLMVYDSLGLEDLMMYDSLGNKDRILRSLGTLGGGNHYIEINVDEHNDKYLVIHSGSRNLGVQVCEHYQKIAREKCTDTTKELEYLTGQDYQNYLRDMRVTQRYADMNRLLMAQAICGGMDWEVLDFFQTIHNYIDKEGYVRKGAVSARQGEKLIIPLNMRDGSLICVGKGNPDWNYSAPHGAGRILSRGKAKRELDLETFQNEMEGVYSTCIDKARLDESPMAYKDYKEIISNIGDTVDIISHIKPLYNFKG